jgi:rhodanese-related sulfurtransferase
MMSDNGGGATRGVITIVACGLFLGFAYNAFGLIAKKPWGLSWIAESKLEALAKSELVSAVADDPLEVPEQDYWTDIDDPLAVPAAAHGDFGLPEIPCAGRPVQIEIGALKQYFDAEAALIIDAREPDDYDDGHIRGAINIPYDIGMTDPASLERLDTGGLPIVTYCGGGTCEVSLTLAEELIMTGHSPVAVYIGGFSEWAEAGYPVDRGQS